MYKLKNLVEQIDGKLTKNKTLKFLTPNHQQLLPTILTFANDLKMFSVITYLK